MCFFVAQNTPVPNQPPTHSTVSKADLMASLKAHAQVAGRLHELLADAIVAFGFNSWEKINTPAAVTTVAVLVKTREILVPMPGAVRVIV